MSGATADDARAGVAESQTVAGSGTAKSDWKPVLIGSAFSLLSAVLASYLTYTIDRTKTQNDFSTKFAETVNESVPHLRDDRESGMSFAGLLALAQTDSQRRAVLIIGVNANTPSIRSTLAAYIGTDEHIAQLAHEPAMRQFILSSVALPGGHVKGTASADAQTTAINTPDESSLRLVQALGPVRKGYVLYQPGRFENMPQRAALSHARRYLLAEPRFVRDAPGDDFGHVVGALPAGTALTIDRFAVRYEHGRPSTWFLVQTAR